MRMRMRWGVSAGMIISANGELSATFYLTGRLDGNGALK